ncbi:MAG: putative manganese transporter [Bacillota bacterium]|nr:putative manganese transporter [Bacillota bacterium]
MIHFIGDSLLDTLKLVPFLFVTYLFMEYIEHKTNDKIEKIIEKNGKAGPLAGALLGIIPQCGISGAAANFYAGRIITVGTLTAIFISTSDEMLPILIASSVPASTVAGILAFKLAAAVVFGFAIDFIFRKPLSHDHHDEIHEMCEKQGCNCEGGNIFTSAFRHTLNISVFIFIVTFICSLLISAAGIDALNNGFFGIPVIGELTASLIGLVPNCASSVIITQLYLEGIMPAGPMISGLAVNSGVGLAILFKVNRSIKENLKITGILFAAALISGLVVSVFNISF